MNARGLRAGGDKAAAEAMLREVEELKARPRGRAKMRPQRRRRRTRRAI